MASNIGWLQNATLVICKQRGSSSHRNSVWVVVVAVVVVVRVIVAVVVVVRVIVSVVACTSTSNAVVEASCSLVGVVSTVLLPMLSVGMSVPMYSGGWLHQPHKIGHSVLISGPNIGWLHTDASVSSAHRDASSHLKSVRVVVRVVMVEVEVEVVLVTMWHAPHSIGQRIASAAPSDGNAHNFESIWLHISSSAHTRVVVVAVEEVG
jgi:hypothetical protein